MQFTQIIERPISTLRPYARNARTHSKKQIGQIAASIGRFGFNNPVLISDDNEIIAGHGRVEAARQLGWTTVPTIALSHLSDRERQAYILADNKLALNAGWDREILAIELQALVDVDFDVELTGFSLAEVDLVLDFAGTLGADVEWSTGGEERLIRDLSLGKLDLVIGGLTSETPWTEKVGVTRPYEVEKTAEGEHHHILAVPMGENGFLVALERFLHERNTS